MASVTLASPSVNSNLIYTSFVFDHSSNDPAAADSFSSYLNLMRKSFLPELGDSEPNHTSIRINSGSKRINTGELDIFDAEKYFSGVMDHDDEPTSEGAARFSHKNEGEGSLKSKSKSKSKSGSESTRSETMSANSQSTLLRNRRKSSPSKERRLVSGKGFLSVFPCSCYRENCINVEKHAGEETGSGHRQKVSYVDEKGGLNPVNYWRSGGQTVWQRRDTVALPISNLAGGKVAVGREAQEREMVGASVRVFGSPVLGKYNPGSKLRKSSILLTSSPCGGGGGGGGGGSGDGDDMASEASSDLFEIDTLSINGHPLFRPEVSYEPSEASIEWSVVTASAANFSVVSDNNIDDIAPRDGDVRKLPKQRRPSILMGCVSHNAVNAVKPERRQEVPVATPVRYHVDGLHKMDLEPARSQRALAVSHARSMR